MNNFQELEHQHPSKKEVKKLAEKEANTYLETGKDVMPDYVRAKRIIDYLTEWTKNVKDTVVNERESFAKTEELRIYGATVTVMEAGARYDFSVCQDTKWDELNNRIEALKKELKQRENYLKGISGSETVVDEETGDINKLFPPKKTSTTVPKVDY